MLGMFGRQAFLFCCAEGFTGCRLNREHDRSDAMTTPWIYTTRGRTQQSESFGGF